MRARRTPRTAPLPPAPAGRATWTPRIAAAPSAEPEDDLPEERPHRRRRGRPRTGWVWWGLIPVAVLVAIVVIAIYLLTVAPGAPVVAVLVKKGTSANVTSGSYWFASFQLNVSEHLGGGFSATPNVTAYVLNHKGYLSLTTNLSENLSTNLTPKMSPWTSGNVSSAEISVRLGKGIWYLLFANVYGSPPAEVVITSSVDLTT